MTQTQRSAAGPFDGLGARAPRVPQLIAPPEGESVTARLRHALRANGQMHGSDLARVVGLAGNSIVRALLKHDIDMGRVLHSDGVYEINEDFEELGKHEIANAIRVLQRYGYEVRRRSGKSIHGENQ
jgi:hypothetical protein